MRWSGIRAAASSMSMVLSVYLVSGLSGSKTADVAAFGSVMRDMLEKEGYSAGEGAAVLAAAAAMGETVPPSLALLVLGSITTLSMAALFVGGIIPAAVVAEGLPALINLAPLLLPIAPGLGLSQLHYAIVLLIAMGVGAFLPPAGVGFYVACAIIGTDIETASRAMLPYLVVLVITLLIVAFVPWFTVFLPGALNLGG
jgi:TRAP-type C4-dicarboxylate transport system permease large subunit